MDPLTPSVNFFGVIGTPKADSFGITESICKAVVNCLNTPMVNFSKRLVAFGSDGAAVMTGRKNVVVAKFRELSLELSPSLVGIHCFAHRLELAINSVIKNTPSMPTLRNFYSTFTSFSNSVH